jgi:hypothetical protein
VTTSFKDGTKEVSSDLLFNPQTILKSPTFGKTSKAFVASQKELSVLEVINSHFKIASSLHEKFMSRTGLHSDPQLRELARIRVARKSMSYRHTLGLILQVAVTQKLNPYEYLHRWFSKEELERAYSLPDHSKE